MIFHSQVMFLRKIHGSRLHVFAPISDLSALSKTGVQERALVPGLQNDVELSGGRILGDEYSDHVVKVGSNACCIHSYVLNHVMTLTESQRYHPS